MSVTRMIVGLGNPGEDYAETRHNVGFMVADAMALGAEATWKSESRWKAEVARFEETILVKPLTYMNDSGRAVLAVADFFKLDPGSVTVVVDDVDLPFGELRFRERGGSGGHKGLASVIASFGTEDIPRLRIGIGRSEHADTTGHVLGRFSETERRALEPVLRHATEALA